MTRETVWLLQWFEGRGSLPPGPIVERLTANYFELGMIDSLSVIELIGDIEAQFHIAFAAEHFQDRRFGTIAGLAELIANMSRDGSA